MRTETESVRETKEKEQQRTKLKELSKKQSGYDEEGNEYDNIADMWEQQLKGDKDKNWYKKSVGYWDGQPATADGVLGGYEEVHKPDSKTSLEMLHESKKWISGWTDALDCGAGIGRITK